MASFIDQWKDSGFWFHQELVHFRETEDLDLSPDEEFPRGEEEDSDDEERDDNDDPYEYDEEISGAPEGTSITGPDSLDDDLILEVLCSNRVSQMTKTYNDIEAVTRLLEEKEKDLELTARIGKELLAHNQKLETNVTNLEAELKTVNEKLTQLSHELLKKTELIQVLTNDVDESGSEGGTPTSLRCINLELMQRRIGSLEDENKQLRKEAYQLAKDTDDCEEAEQRLVQDIASQLASANMEVTGLADELLRYKEENRQQHEQITSLSSKLADADVNVHRLTLENEHLSSMLHITKENQSKLATELADLKDRYAEVMTLLHDTQDQLRKQRRKATPMARGGSYFPSLSSALNPDSLASELESSLYSEQSLDSGISTDRVPNYKKVFETVRCASRNSSSSCASANESPMHHPRGVPQPQFSFGNTVMSSTISSGPRMSSFITPQTGPKSLDQSRRAGGSVYSSSLSYPSVDSFGHSDSDFSVITDSEDSYPGGVRAGVPGVPGAADLEAALRRLTPAEVLARRATLSMGSYDYTDGCQTPPTYLPFGCRTPDSIMSTGSSRFSNQSGGWKIPEKLQIVKPMEGSLTLAAWAQLATPTLGGLLDDRPGVKIRGGKLLEDLGFELYSLSDLEEDEYCNPGKSFQHTGSIYTYTNSTVLHPDDSTSVTPSVRGSKMCTVSNSCQNSGAPPTPVCLSRRGSTSTFSTTLGLAKMLNERGIKAVTPSAVCTPCGDRSFSPTATPCNSPDGTPPPSPPPSPSPYNPLKFAGFFSSGANLLRRTLTGECERANSRKSKRSKSLLSRSERKALKDIKLMEQLESIGLENIMSTTASSITPVTLQGALYTRRITKSPMTQLTSLKTAVSSSSRTDKKSDSEKSRTETSTPSPVYRDLGVPGHPGSGELHASLSQGIGHKQRSQVRGTVRPDLGKVLGKVPPKRCRQENEESAPQQSTLGTINSLLFGRKGGLL